MSSVGAAENASGDSLKPMTATRRGRTEAAVGAVGVVVLVSATPGWPAWASYVLVWTVLLAAITVALFRRPRLGPGTNRVWPIRFTFTWMDVLVGAFVGLLLRAVIIVVELTTFGYVSSSSSMFAVPHDLLWIATAVIAPAVVAPVVEELFFRGLVLPAIGINWIGIVASSIIFSAVHLAHGFNLLTAVSTLIVGIVLGLLAVRTGRLGAGITAHIVYNASLIAVSELGGLVSING